MSISICHALTANSDVESWWPGMVGKGLLLILISFLLSVQILSAHAMGQQGPGSVNPLTGKQWLSRLPLITVRDAVRVHDS